MFSPGPTAPLHWMKDCVEELALEASTSQRAKVLLGLNFYGYDFGSSGMEGKSCLFKSVVYLFSSCRQSQVCELEFHYYVTDGL